MEIKEPRTTKTIFKTKNQIVGLTLPDFKFSHKATIIRAVQFWHRDKQVGQWNEIAKLEVFPPGYEQLIFEKGTEKTLWKKNNLFSHAEIKLC